MRESIDKSILSVQELLQLENLAIPSYQRPYKWTQANLSQLFQDLQAKQDKTAYRLGTVVFHLRSEPEGSYLDIVDGQQRTLTLALAVQAIIEVRLGELDRSDLRQQLEHLKSFVDKFMSVQRFSSEISKHNLHQNYLEVKRIISRNEFTENHIDFLLNKCQVVVFTLENISEAFQFFDSQNARGRDLEPHDLLKAYHLREFAEHESELKGDTVAHWESLNSDDLAQTFAIYLFRIRQWAQGKSARYFSKNQVGLFKGVNLNSIGRLPYVESLNIAHHYVDDYNRQYHRDIDGQKMRFPFHLDQMIINGRRFFEMTEHYQQQISSIVASEHHPSKQTFPVSIGGVVLSENASNIIMILNSYQKRTRTGDKYIRSMFDCALIFYMDKFGDQRLSSAIEKIFIWAYSCRIKQQVVQLATMDNHVLGQNLFRTIKEATLPSEFLSIPLEAVKDVENINNRGDDKPAEDPLVKLFMSMSYYE